MDRLQLTGLASGLDWKSLVDQLMQIERIPQNRLRVQKNSNTQRIDALTQLETRLGGLKTAAEALRATSTLGARKGTFSQSALGWSSTVDTTALTGSAKIEVTQLATRSQRTGTAGIGSGAGDASDPMTSLRLGTLISAGSVTVNGATLTVDPADSLEEFLAALETATNGVVSGTWQGNRLTLTSTTGELQLGAPGDTSNFLSAMQLNQSAVQTENGSSSVTSLNSLGVVRLFGAAAESGLSEGLSGSGSFLVNGVAIAFDADTESLSTLIERVNGSSAGVTLAYDRFSDSFRLTNRDTGAFALSVQDSENGILSALGLTGATQTGENARFRLDDGAVLESFSNRLTSAEHGLTGVTLTATTTGVQTFTVQADTSQSKAAIQKFIDEYNKVQSYIEQQTRITRNDDNTVTTGTLASNSEVNRMETALRRLVFEAVPDSADGLRRLADMGIDFVSGSSRLEIKDNAALDDALANRQESVTAFFSAADGFANKLVSRLETMSGSGSSLQIGKDTLARRNRALDAEIATIDRQLQQRRELMEASFIRMEQVQSEMQRQLASLSNLPTFTPRTS